MSKRILKMGCWSLPAVLVLAAGCNFAPEYKVPPVAAPAGYKETNGWRAAEPADAMIKGRWWEVFDDPQLNALEDQVNVSNQNVIAALENFLAARAVAKQARSELFPTASLVPAYTRSEPSANTHGSFGPVPPFSDYNLPVQASWEPDLWGSIRNTFKASTYAAQASAAQLENLRLSLQAELAEDYYLLRGQDEMIELFSNTIVNYKDSLSLTKTLFETGIDSDLDVAQADTLLQTTLAQATALGIQRAQYEHAIAMLVGQPASTFSIKPGRFVHTPPNVPVGLPGELLQRRPDIAAAERAVAQGNATIGVARAAYFPTISLTGTGGYQSSTVSRLLRSSSFYWALGATASETIFDAGRRKAATEQAWANYRGSVANYRQTVLAAYQQVEDDIAALRILADQTAQQDTAVKASRKNLDLSMERYRQGLSSYLNVITAEVSLLGNQQTAVGIHMEQMTASVQLVMALGGGWSTNDLPTPKGVMRQTKSN